MLRAKQTEDNDHESRLWREGLSESIRTAFDYYGTSQTWEVQKAIIIDDREDDCRIDQSNPTIYYRRGLDRIFSLIKAMINKEMNVVTLKVGHLSSLVLAFVGELTDSDKE